MIYKSEKNVKLERAETYGREVDLTKSIFGTREPQWIQVDLGLLYDIDRVVLTWETACATAYDTQISDECAAWTTICSTTTGDGEVDDFSVPVSGRYMRIYGPQRVEIGGNRYGY